MHILGREVRTGAVLYPETADATQSGATSTRRPRSVRIPGPSNFDRRFRMAPDPEQPLIPALPANGLPAAPSTGGEALERRLLRGIASHPRVPAAVRGAVARLERSSIGYRLAHGAFWSLAGTALSRAPALAASVFTARLLG